MTNAPTSRANNNQGPNCDYNICCNHIAVSNTYVNRLHSVNELSICLFFSANSNRGTNNERSKYWNYNSVSNTYVNRVHSVQKLSIYPLLERTTTKDRIASTAILTTSKTSVINQSKNSQFLK